MAGFHKKDELASLLHRRVHREPLDVARVKNAIVERYYQKRAIGSIGERFGQARRKALLVMATGSGKTRVAVALVDLLQRAGWVKRALFLADRVSLVNQAVGAFKAHLPESSPVNLVTEKDKAGRVYVCTYPTMMGLIDETTGTEARFGVGHFDLVIIDEAHRSVYQKYGAIFRYFDSLLVGLTATPRDQVDRNTYELFDLEPGVPTDVYELATAVADGFLVPPKVQQVDLRFPREGIDYDSLSEEEQAQWESLDWGDDEDDRGLPERVNASAVNSWLFNNDTVDKVLQHLMEHGHKVEGGDRLAKTIVFARNHAHATFIEARFNHHYPRYAGHFARIIDHYATYPQSLLDDFAQKDKAPHIAISVDMLDTGIDIPEVANLVFFKPVYSRIKFWQMIGRGTRLCPDLFGPGDDKHDFRVFDFCFNFDFFREHPEGIEDSGGVSLRARLFRSRVQLLTEVQATPDLDPEAALAGALTTELHREVAAMNRENFIVRMQLEAVERFRQRESWERLTASDVEILQSEVAGLPSEIETDDIESRLFDLTALKMQLALAEGDTGTFERHRRRVVEIAMLLEEKSAIPAVTAQLAYLVSVQESAFWEGIALNDLEELRLRLRGLVPFLDKKTRKVVYTDFQDEITAVREDAAVYLPKMTGVQYEKKVQEYLKNHLDHIVIRRLRTNQPLTATDLRGLEQTLVEIGEDDGRTLLTSLLARNDAPSLPHFVRSLVGMDRAAAQGAFSEFLTNRSLTTPQIRFIEMVIEQLTARGVMDNYFGRSAERRISRFVGDSRRVTLPVFLGGRVGHRRSGSAIAREANDREDAGGGRGGGRNERADGAPLAGGCIAVDGEGAADVADAGGRVRRRVGVGGRAAVGGGCGGTAAGSDAVPGAVPAASGSLRGGAAADAATAGPGVAGAGRPGARGVLRAGGGSGSGSGVRLHGRELVGSDDSRGGVPAPAVRVGAELQPMDVCVAGAERDVRGAGGGAAGRALDAGCGAGGASSRQPVGGDARAEAERRAAADGAVPGGAGPLRAALIPDPAGEAARERRGRAGALPDEDGPRAGVAVAGREGLRRRVGVSGLRAGGRRRGAE